MNVILFYIFRSLTFVVSVPKGDEDRLMYTMLREIGFGHKVKRPISMRRRLTENSIFNIVSSHDTYVAGNNILNI